MSDGENYLIWSIGTVFQLLALIMAARIMLSRRGARGLVGFLVAFSIFTSEFIPPFYSLISDQYPDWIYFLRDNSISCGVLLSGIYWVVFVGALHFFQASRSTIALSGKIANHIPRRIFREMLLAIAAVSFLGYYTLDPQVLEEGFASASGLMEGRNVRTTLLTGLLGPFGSLALPSAAALIAVSLMGDNIKSPIWKWLRRITWGFVASTVIFCFTLGARGQLLSVTILISMIVWIFHGRHKVVYALGLTAVIGVIISPVIMIYKSQKNLYVGAGTIERIENIYNVYEDSSQDIDTSSAIEGIIFRYDGVHNGGNLALFSTENDHPYFMPYLNTLLGVVPRYFWPEKPQPKSVDGSASTTPNVMTGVVSGRPLLMTSVTPSAVAFWHFDILGLLLLPTIQAWITSILVRLSDNRGRPDLFLFYFNILAPTGLSIHTLFMFIQWVFPISLIVIIMKIISRRHPVKVLSLPNSHLHS